MYNIPKYLICLMEIEMFKQNVSSCCVKKVDIFVYYYNNY